MKSKLMIAGHGRHGKDAVADLICYEMNKRQVEDVPMKDRTSTHSTWKLPTIKKMSSSMFAIARTVVPRWKEIRDDYVIKGPPVLQNTPPQVLADRIYQSRGLPENREILKRMIREYNTPDEARLMRELYEDHNIYVGVRRLDEFIAGANQRLFDFSLYVEGGERVPEVDATCEIEPEHCDAVLLNNSSYNDLVLRVQALCRILR